MKRLELKINLEGINKNVDTLRHNCANYKVLELRNECYMVVILRYL